MPDARSPFVARFVFLFVTVIAASGVLRAWSASIHAAAGEPDASAVECLVD